VSVATINHKGASGSAVRPVAKSRAGRESGELRGDSARLRSARVSLRRIPKEVADCLKFVLLIAFTGRGSSWKLYRLAARIAPDNLWCKVRMTSRCQFLNTI
jgi:hypothetical protein